MYIIDTITIIPFGEPVSTLMERDRSRHPEVKKILWGGKFWTSGYYINTVGRHGNEDVIANYVKYQGRQYQQIHRNQLELFD